MWLAFRLAKPATSLYIVFGNKIIIARRIISYLFQQEEIGHIYQTYPYC